MEEGPILKLIMEKGPREGETLEFRPGTAVKIGRVVRGNTIGIKDAGISTKHLSIQFDQESSRWNVTDLESSNGTLLNGVDLSPNVPSGIGDGDCIKIGELTSIIVKIVGEAGSQLRRNPRRKGRGGAAAASVVGREKNELGVGFDEDLGGIAVGRRNLRSRAKKEVDSNNEVDRMGSRRTTRSSKKEENVSFNSTLGQIPEEMKAIERVAADLVVAVEGKRTRGGGAKRGRKKKSPVEPLGKVENSVFGENLENNNESVCVDVEEELKLRQEVCERKEAAVDESRVEPLENVENSILDENLDKAGEFVQVDVTEELKSRLEMCGAKEAVVDENLLSEEALEVNVDKGKEVVEEMEYKEDGCDGSVKNNGPDISLGLNLEKMTLGDFFDYLEVQLPKEIHDKSEKIISDLKEKALKCHEFRLQRNENDKGKQPID